MEKHYAFGLIYNSQDFCVIKSILSEDTKYLIELLPKNKKCFIFFGISWQYEDNLIIKNWIECFSNNIVYYLLANNEEQKNSFDHLGYSSILVNQNCFLDYNLYTYTDQEKIYNLVVNSRLIEFKRHHLLEKINDKIAYISYDHFDVKKDFKDNFLQNLKKENFFTENISTQQLIAILNQSKIGAILSNREGSCYASTEYLFCGIPVLSTPSVGGRDLWYNEENSVICEPNSESIYESYRYMLEKKWDSKKIRNKAIILAAQHRKIFIKKLQEIFEEMGHGNVSAYMKFQLSYFNKMVKYISKTNLEKEIKNI